MTKLLGALVGVLLLAGCGAAPSPSVTGSPSPAAQLTVEDNGRTVTVRVGDVVEVALQQQSGFSEWSHPTSMNEKVLAPVVDTHATAVRGMTLAAFKAVAKGRSDLQAGAGAHCSPGAVCPAIARGWQVHVVVS